MATQDLPRRLRLPDTTLFAAARSAISSRVPPLEHHSTTHLHRQPLTTPALQCTTVTNGPVLRLQFRSFAAVLNCRGGAAPTTHKLLRQVACAQLRSHSREQPSDGSELYPPYMLPEECSAAITEARNPVAAYADYLSTPNVDGDNVTIIALTDALQCRACLVEAGGRCTWYPDQPDSSHPAGRDVWLYHDSVSMAAACIVTWALWM
jgi:hypothetical protein